MKRKTQLGILILTAILLLTSVQIGSGEEVINIYNYIKKSDDIRWANKNICLVGCKIPENPDKCECATVYEITPKELTFVQDGIKLDSKNLWFMFRSKNKINLVNNLAQNFDWKNVWYWINVTKIGYNIEYDGSYYPCGIYEYDRKTYNKTCYNDTLIKNESYLYESWEPFAFDKPILSKDIKLGITGWKRLGSDVDHIPNFKIKNRNYTLSDVDWWNSTWLNRRNITVRNNELYTKGEELQYIYSIPGVYPNGCSNEARLIDHSDNSSIPFDVLNSTLTTCKIAFITSLAGSSSKTYGFYYNSTTAVAPVETSFLHLYDDFNDSTLSNVGDQAYNGVGLADYSNANVESVSGGILAVAVNGDGAPRFEHENLPITVPMSSAQLYFVQDFISSLNEHGFGLGSGSSTMRAAYATEGNLGRVFYYYDGSYSLLASSGWGSSIDIVGRIHIDTSANLGIYTIYDGTHSNTINATQIINDNSYSSLAFFKKDPSGDKYRIDRYGIGNRSFNFYNQRSVITIGSQEAYIVPNQPPIITAINISSENGLNLTNEDLIGDFVYYDPDSDPESSNQTKWFKNGIEQVNLINLMRINKGNTSVGDFWIFSARVNDGTVWSNWYNSSALIILNSPPSISMISLTSSGGINRTSANLYGNYTFADIDNDSEANKETKWFKNNIEQGSLNNLMSIASSNTSKGENWIFSARVNDGTAWSNWYNSSSLLIVNTPPTAPSLSSPPDGAAFNQTKELNWTNSVDADNEPLTYRLELDDNNTFVSLIYINVSIAEDPSGITGDPKVMLGLNLADDKTYYWRIKANDGIDNSSWSNVWQFTYALFDINFNVTNLHTKMDIKKIDSISCDNGFSVVNSRNINPITYTNSFIGVITCNFVEDGYYNELVTFIADANKMVQVQMTPAVGLTPTQAFQLEYLFNCFNNNGSGNCWNSLDRIELNTKKIWNMSMRTNQSVVISENVLSKLVNSTQNLTINYTLTIPTKEGFGPEDFLPIRLHYWFLNEQNTSCYNQGDKPTAVEDPYCQPLTASTIGKVGDTLTFTVDLRPTGLPSGQYSLVRELDIDPNNVWIRYGQERLGTITISEEGLIGGVHLERLGGLVPSAVQKTTELSNTVTGDKIANQIEQIQEMIQSLKEKLDERSSSDMMGITGNIAQELVGKGSLIFTIGFFILITLVIGYVIGKKVAQKRN